MKASKLIYSAALIAFSHHGIGQTGQWKLAGNNLNGTQKLGSINSSNVNFVTNNATRMTLSAVGNLGIGTTGPEANLHVFRGSAGTVTGFFNAPLIVENSTHSYINLLAPNADESGILFGKPESSISGGIIYNNLSTPNGLQFRTHNNFTRMVLTNNGFLGLNTVSPAAELHVLHANNNSNGLRLENNTAGGKNWTIFEFGFSDGDLGLAASGALRGFFSDVSGAYSTVSDMRVKKDIEQAPDLLEKVMQLQVKKYHFLTNKTSDNKYYGMIAQDVEKIFPEIVSHKVGKDHDVYAVDYSAYGVLAIKAIQEQQKTIEEQRQKITTLEDRIAKLEATLTNDRISSAGSSNNITSKELNSITLEQNQPNPFNQTTTIRYHLPPGSNGQINVYDVNGTLVKSLKADESGKAVINGSDLKGGTYAYTLLVNGKPSASKKLVFIK